MNVIRVKKVADGEELVLTEELWEARLDLGHSDPRAESLERRHKALTDPLPLRPRRSSGVPSPRPRAGAREAGTQGPSAHE